MQIDAGLLGPVGIEPPGMSSPEGPHHTDAGGVLLPPRVSPAPHTQPGGPACLDLKPPYQLGTSWDLTFLIYKM